MLTQIIPVRDPVLRRYIQYFIFFETGVGETAAFTTFPNTNVCLAVYDQNTVLYSEAENQCEIGGNGRRFPSRLYGFHRQPFQVRINDVMQEMCMLFEPGGLRAFSNVPFETLAGSEDVFEMIFGVQHTSFLTQMFAEPEGRGALLEAFLLQQLGQKPLNSQVQEAMWLIHHLPIHVDEIAKRLSVNASTLYRLFHAHIGQSPKAFLQTVRFRQALGQLLQNNTTSLTSLAYAHDYYDQAHFIKQIRSLSGLTPSQLKKNIAVEQQELAWIYQG